ncbi:MAG: DNA adenine methylase [Novosphingobium sp.]
MLKEYPELVPVAPVRPLAPYIGGKRNLARRLVQRINAVPHQTYAEVFVGMGGVFLRRDRRPKGEVINDWSEDVATFFRVVLGSGARFDVTKIAPMIEAVHERLAGVIIERLPWQEFIARYDRPGTLFYLDPPYYGCETDYGRDMFQREEFEVMADMLRTIRGRFILSLNDHPEVRRLFDGFAIEEAKVRYQVGGMDNSKLAGEVIISH